MTDLSLSEVGGVQVDSRVANDARWILDHFKVKFTAGYATTGHAANGEHPVGLALDIVPDFAHGGTWADVDRLARWAEPKQNDPRAPFRWVGYNGDPDHGRYNHLHLSWLGKGSPLVPTITGDSEPGGVSGLVDDVGDTFGGAASDVAGAAGGAAAGLAGGIVSAIVDALGIDGPKILLTLVLVGGGAWLATLGAARMAGLKVGPGAAQELGLLVATEGAAGGAGAGAKAGASAGGKGAKVAA